MFTRRLLVCIIAGALLGVICIIGAQVRSGFTAEATYLFSFWYNRLLMGVAIGLAGGVTGAMMAIGRGALLGLLVSFAFYSSTGFGDAIGFAAGIIYGILIEFAAFKLVKKAT